MSLNFTPTKKSSPCPLCGNTSGHCKTGVGPRDDDSLLYCHNNTGQTPGDMPLDGWFPLGDTADGQWGIFTDEPPKKPNPGSSSVGSSRPNRKGKATKPAPTVTAEQRHATFTTYMEGKTLHPDDRADLERRDFTDEQIAVFGAVSLEGEQPGYLCLCRNPQGQILGAQWRLRSPGEEDPRYKWVSWLKGSQFNGELPLTCHRPGHRPTGIAAVEGVGAKSFLLAQRLGFATIGAGAAAQFQSSPEQWRAYLAELAAELNTKEIHFFPDAGAVQNSAVWRNYQAWFDLVQSLGYTVSVAWWGQTEKSAPDIDELQDPAVIEWLTVEQLRAIAAEHLPAAMEQQPQEVAWDCLPSLNHQVGEFKIIELGSEPGDEAKIEALQKKAEVNSNIEYLGVRTAQPNQHKRGGDVAEIHKFKVFTPKLSLDFEVVKTVEDPEGGYLGLRVQQVKGRSLGTKNVLIRSTDLSQAKDFVKALKRSLGSDLACTLSTNELQALIQNRTARYHAAGGKTYRLAPRTGRQYNGFWIFENCQFDKQGNRCTEEESGWIFNPNLGTEEQIPSPKIAEPNPQAIADLVNFAARVYNPQVFPKALFTLGYGAASSRRDEIIADLGGFPQLNCFGEHGAGKTTSAEMAAALYGTHRFAITSFSESVVYELAKSLGGVVALLDDVTKKDRSGKLRDQVDNFAWAAYNGHARKVRGNEQKPHTNVIFTTNPALGEGNGAIESRLLKFYFGAGPIDTEALATDSQRILDAASGGLGQIIALPYSREAIQALAGKIAVHLPTAHKRLAVSYAIVTHYTQELCRLAGYEFDALEYCCRVLCKEAEGYDSNRDDLTDFLLKVEAMRAAGTAGEWNLTRVRSGGKPYLAVYLTSLWPEFERQFPGVNYSRQSIQQKVETLGGSKDSRQRFVDTKQAWLDYQRELARVEAHNLACDDPEKEPWTLPAPPAKLSRACVLIPASAVDAALGADGAVENLAVTEADDLRTVTEIVPFKKPQPGTVATILQKTQGLEEGETVKVATVAVDQKSSRHYAVVQRKEGRSPEQVSVWLEFLNWGDCA